MARFMRNDFFHVWLRQGFVLAGMLGMPEEQTWFRNVHEMLHFVTFRLVLKSVIVTGLPPMVVGGHVIPGVSQQLDLDRLPYCCSCSRPSVAIPCERVTTATAVPLL